MKKKVYIDRNAERELRKFSEEVQLKFEAYFRSLRLKGRLDFPEARKITRNLFEIRVKLKGIYRGFYAYVGESDIIVLHVFRKKTQRMPIKNLKIAKRRLEYYE